MWKAWQFPHAIRLRHSSREARREAKVGCRHYYAINAPERHCSKGKLLKGGGRHVGEKRNSILAVDTAKVEEFDLKPETREKYDVHSLAKSCSGIGRFVIAKCSHIFESRGDVFDRNCSLRDALKPGLWLSPETLRRYWRVSELRPEDFLDILIGFGPEAVQVRKARFLWNLYRWASLQRKEFQHLARSNESMVSILAAARMLAQAESLLLSLADSMAPAVATELFSQVIQAYSSEYGNLEKSIKLYNFARYKNLIPSVPCYQVLLHFLIRNRKDELVLKIYLDMLEVGLGSCTEGDVLDFVVTALIKKDNFLQVLGILRQLKRLGLKLSKGSLSTVVEEFNKQKDVRDMMNFLEEWRCLPELRVCNRILAFSCTNHGTDEALLAFQRLEALGFAPDATTFGIFICHSCREMKLKSAFIYLSECFSRHIKPKVSAYNAILGGVFREGLYRHAKYVFEDMVDRKVMPDVSTYKIILAGYCRYRQFDHIEQVLRDMKTNGVNEIPSGNCVLSKALSFLGLDHLEVKVKRDNATGFPKAEFFDSLGNGLYLDTDAEKFEISLAQIFANALQPDINSQLVNASKQGNVASALLGKDEAFQWGHGISSANCAQLIRTLCLRSENIMDVVDLMKEMPDTFNKIDAQTLNIVVRKLSSSGMSAHARLVLDILFRGGLSVNKDTFTYLMTGFCEEMNIEGFWECWSLATKYTWSPDSKDVMGLITSLCKWGVIEEALKLIDQLLDSYPRLFLDAYCALLKDLCRTGYTTIGCAMLEALIEKFVVEDHSLLLNVMEGFLKEQKTSESIGIYDLWLNKRKVLDAFTHQLALSSLPWLDAERVMDLVDSMAAMKFTESSPFFCIVKELVQMGNLKHAMSVFQDANCGKYNGTLLNSLFEAYGCLKDWRKSNTVLCMMLKMRTYISISGYRCLISRMCEQSRFASASSLKVLFQHSDTSRELISYNILMFYLFKKRNSSQVHELLKDMKGNGISPDETTYDFLIYGFQKSGDTDSSVNMLDACIAKGLQPSNRSLRIVLNHHCRLGNLEKSLALFHLIELNGWKHGLTIYTTLTSCLLSFGRHYEAKSCLNKLSKCTFPGSDISLDACIKKFCILGDLQMSINLMNTMLEKGRFPSESSYSSVIYRLCVLKEFDQALNFLAEMQLAGLKPSYISCDVLICGLCSMGRTCDARNVLEMLTTLGSIPSYDMYRVIFDNYCRSSNLQKAAAVLRDMQQTGQAPNFEMHWSVISNFSSTDNKPEQHTEPILPNLFSMKEAPMKHNKG